MRAEAGERSVASNPVAAALAAETEAADRGAVQQPVGKVETT